MRKVYIANSVIAFTLVVNGSKRRVSFERLSNDKSYLSTCDEGLQEALESYPDFNKEYRLENYEKPVVKEEKPELKNVMFTSAVSARDFLVNQHGETTSSTRTVAKIIEAGKRHGLNIIID